MMSRFPVQFHYIPYPLWRRRFPGPVRAVLQPVFRRWLSADADAYPPETPDEMIAYLRRWKLMPDMEEGSARRLLDEGLDAGISVGADARPRAYTGEPVRLPAQWEPMEAIILTWPVFYPPLWRTHAALVEAISAVADVTVMVPRTVWGSAARLFLLARGLARMERVRFLHLPVDDIWVRDYGPIIGQDSEGRQVAVDAIYDPLAKYPQERDDAMPSRWAAYRDVPILKLDLHLEGGNLWSDGAGTLLMSEHTLLRHRGLSREDVLRRLHAAFDFDRLIFTPYLALEETAHVDLLVKLADEETVLVAAPSPRVNRQRLIAAARLLRLERNARGQPYNVIELPMPPMYLNWGIFPVWRSYTNALTVNGRVLVPVFGVREDERALAVYERAMPKHLIIPIDCAASANGGGAVHCLTKEVPLARGRGA